MGKVMPESLAILCGTDAANTRILMRKIADELPEDVIHQIYLFCPRGEGGDVRRCAPMARCRYRVSKHFLWFVFLGSLTFQVIAFYIGAYITGNYGVGLLLVNLLVGYSCLAIIIAICLLIEKCCCTPSGY